MHPTKKIIVLAVAGILAFAGCALKHEPVPMPVMTQPVEPEAEPTPNTGSLFDPYHSEFLVEDNRASRVGDIVLVVVSEVSKADHKANTDAKRNTDTAITMTAFAKKGLMGNIPLVDPFKLDSTPGATGSAQNNFKGESETKNESTLTATVATRIVKILPGRVLQVEGARRIRVNNETQILVVRGFVRQRDIAADNSVPSSNLAEAQIEVYGQGVLSDKQKPGWLSRILDNIWPF